MRPVYLSLLPALFFSCSNNSSAPFMPADSAAKDGTMVADSTFLNTDTISNIKAPAGIFSAVITCKGCKPIEQTVAFLPGGNYRMEEQKRGERNEIERTSGTWITSGGVILLYKDKIVKARYVWHQDTLYYHHANGEKTRMEKRPAAADNKVWRKKEKEGLAFYGVGNEPFWNIGIDEKAGIRFQLADWDKPAIFKAEPPLINGDSIIYMCHNDTASMVITIFHRFCSDGMSDFIYNHQIAVDYKGSVFKGCGILFGR